MRVHVALILSLLLLLPLLTPATAQDEDQVPTFKGRTAAQWTQLLETGEPAEKRQAVWALWNLIPGAKAVAPALARAIRTDDEYILDTASKALVKLGPAMADATPALAEALGDERAAVRREAATLLFRLGPSGKPALDALVGALEDSDPIVRSNAAASLRTFGEAAAKAVPKLMELLDDDNRSVQKWAVAALSSLDVDALVEHLIAKLADEDPVRRLLAARDLAMAYAKGKAAAPALARLLGDKDARVRAEAAGTLGVVATGEALSELGKLLHDELPDVRKRAVASIGYAAGGAVSYLPALTKCLEDENADVRLAAVQAVWSIGESSALPHVYAALEDEDPRVRASACSAVGTLGKDQASAVAKLVARLEDEQTTVVSSASLALSQLGKAAAAALPALISLTRSEDTWCRQAAIQALWRIAPEDERAIAAFVSGLKSADSVLRNTAAQGLGAAGPRAASAVPALIRCLREHEDANTRLPVALALGSIGPAAKASIPALRETMAADSGKGFLGYGPHAAYALARVDPNTVNDAVDYLAAALDNPNRAAVSMYFLAQMGPAAMAAVPKLLEILDSGSAVSGSAAFSIVSISRAESGAEKRAMAHLVRMLREERLPEFGAQAAANFISKLGRRAAEAVPALTESLDSDDPFLVKLCCVALGEMGPAAKEALPKLEKLWESADKAVQASAKEAAAKIRSK